MNLGLLHCTQVLYHLSHQRSPVCIHRCVYTAASGLLGDSRSGRDLVGRQGNVQFQYFKIKILHLFSAWVLQNRWSLFRFSNVNFVCNQLMAQELPESQDLHAELVHQPVQFYHQVSMRQGGKVAGSPRIHLLNCRGSTSPRPAPTQLCQCVCVCGAWKRGRWHVRAERFSPGPICPPIQAPGEEQGAQV